MAASSQLVQIALGPPPRASKPEWLKAKAPVGENFHNLKKLARGLGLHTVCESAQCPNIGECWNHRTATFMLLGDICTRRCGFCAVPKGRPEPIDWDEPRRVAEAVATLGIKHAVVTSVNRDDDNVGGARIFAETIRLIRELVPDCRVEVLIPDFQGSESSLRTVLEAGPDVLNRYSHRRAISETVTRSPAYDALLHACRIHLPQRRSPEVWVQTCGVRAAGAVQLSRARAGGCRGAAVSRWLLVSRR